MPRDLVLGNGRLFLALDERYETRDVYYPHVGLENHAGGYPSRLGVWVGTQRGGKLAWTRDAGWTRHIGYRPGTLVGRATLTHERLGVRVVAEEAVHPERDVLASRFTVENLRARKREIRLFRHYDLRLYGNDIGDTAFFDPATRAVMQYKNERWFLSHLRPPEGARTDYSTGVKGFRGLEGTWRDAEDGALQMNAMTHGSVDFTQGAHLALPAEGSAVVEAWLAAGRDWDAVRALHRWASRKGAAPTLEETARYWEERVPVAPGPLARGAVGDLYRQSIPLVASEVADTGGILAANDTDIQSFNRDHYSYVWPRDGAFVAHALDRVGLHEPAGRYYRFLLKCVTDEGYLLHKYNVNGTLASTWHSWLHEGAPVLPVQEDETALSVWGLLDHVTRSGDLALARAAWPTVQRMADWMARFRDPATGLPLPSWDPWEERRGVLTYTCATVIAGLHGASALAHLLKRRDPGWSEVADEVLAATEAHLYNDEEGRFCRLRPYRPDAGLGEMDMTPDASQAALSWFGLLPVDDPRVRRTMKAVEARLTVPGPVGGVARYEQDYYHQQLPFKKAPGNPWVVCTLWLADYHSARGNLRRARALLDWVVARARPSGALAEQFHPLTGAPLSVSPLTWSHAAFITSCQRYSEAASKLSR